MAFFSIVRLFIFLFVLFFICRTVVRLGHLGQVGLVEHVQSQSSEGYTLFATNGYDRSRVHLVNLEGEVVQQWQSHPNASGVWRFARLRQNGNLVVLRYRSKRDAILEYDWHGNLLRELPYNTHHDFVLLENGNYLFNSYGPRLYDKTLCKDPTGCRNFTLTEMDSEGKVVWDWQLADHLPSAFPHMVKALPTKSEDWAHTNGIFSLQETPLGKRDPRFRKGNLILSIRNHNTLAIIDRNSGAVVWTWGQNILDGQHCPTMLENGNILVLDNGQKNRRHSRVLEIEPVSGTIVWQYSARNDLAKFHSPGSGCAQRLPNGNTLITQAFSGRIFEVTRNGQVVWDYVNPDLLLLPGLLRHLFRVSRLSHRNFLPERQLDRFKIETGFRYSGKFFGDKHLDTIDWKPSPIPKHICLGCAVSKKKRVARIESWVTLFEHLIL